MLVINILQGLLGRGPIFLNLHQLYGLYPDFLASKMLPYVGYHHNEASKYKGVILVFGPITVFCSLL